MTSVEKRRSGRKSGGHRKHSDGGYSDTSSGGSFLDETDREVSNLTDRAFRSLCIGDEAVYNDSDLCSSSPCNQRDRQLAFSQSGQGRDREDRERAELKRSAYESFSLRVQQYGQDWIHGGMYSTEIHRDPQWEVYGERTQDMVSATFQHSLVETSKQEESLREDQLSFLSNGATELSLQQRRSRSRVSSLIRAFNSEGHRDGAGTDGKLREWNDESSWDKSALMSIQRELSEFSASYQQNFNSGHFPSAGTFSSGDTNFYSSEVAAVAHMNSASSFMRSSHSKHSMSAQVNCNSNFFIHSEFSPFKVWRDHNRFPFQQGQVSGFMHCSEFPKWYETPMYKELALEAQPQGPYRFDDRAIRHPRNNLAPVVPPTASHSTSTSTMLQKALPVEKRCESELAGHYPHRKRTQSLGTNRLPSQRPSTASPTIEMSRRVQDTISSVKALQQKIKMMTEQNITTGKTANQQGVLCNSDNLIPFGNHSKTVAPNVVSSNTSTTPFNISQLLTPLVPAHQELEAVEAREYAVSPQLVEHPPVRAESRGATPDVRVSSYKSRATSLLFNLKDNRKRVKSTYSPTKFKGLETPERNKQGSVQEPKDTVIDIPDFPDPDIQCSQVAESSRTDVTSHQYLNQYHNPGTLISQPATTHTGQYSEYTLSEYQPVQMQGEMVHHSGFTGFIPENYTSHQLANGQNLHEDLSSFTPYKQGMMDNVETLGGDTCRPKPSYTAAETSSADNNQTRQYLISKANTEQHYNETVEREFTKVDRYQTLKDNKHDYSNVSSQDRWRQTGSQDKENLSLKAVISPWKQEITALMEKDQHTQAYQKAAFVKEEWNLPRDKHKGENQQSINKEPNRSLDVETSSSKRAGLVNPEISNQLPQYAPFSHDTVENQGYYGQQQPRAFKDKYVLQRYYGDIKENEMKPNYLAQNYNKYTDQEYGHQQIFNVNTDKSMLMKESGQGKPIPKGYEISCLQPTEAKPQFEHNMQKKSLSNSDNVSAPTMENQVEKRKFVEVKSEQATAEHIKAQHAQPELAKTQHWAQVEQPKAEMAKLILAGWTGSEKVRAEQDKAELSEQVNQLKAEHFKHKKREDKQTGQSREKQSDQGSEILTNSEQTRAQEIIEEPKYIQEEAEHMRECQGKQGKAEQAETERLKEERIKTKLTEAEQAGQARMKQTKTEQARRESVKAEQLEEEQVSTERIERERNEAEQIRIEMVKAEKTEAEGKKAEQANLEQIKEQQAKAEQETSKVAKEDLVQVDQTNTQQRTAQISNAKEEEAERLKAEPEKFEQANLPNKVKLTKTGGIEERSVKPAVTQQVKSEPDKVEQVKTELAKAKAELAKIKEKMRGEQKEKVKNTIRITEDEIKKDAPIWVNINKNDKHKDQENTTQMHEQREDSAVVSRQSTGQANRGGDEYNRLREKYGFTDTAPTNRIKMLSTAESVPSNDAKETPALSLDEVETMTNEKLKDKHSQTSGFATANMEKKEEVGNLNSIEVTESHYVYSESSKEFKLFGADHLPSSVDRDNSDNVTDKVKDDSVDKIEKCDPLKHTDVSQQTDSDLAKPLSLERKPKSSEHSVGPGKDMHFTPPKALSHKERAQTKQEILTSKIKAHAEKEISAIKEKGFAIRDGFKTSTKHLTGSQSINIRQRPPSQEVSKKHESTMSSNTTPKHQMEPSGTQMESVKSVSPPSCATIPLKSALTSSQLEHSQKQVSKEPIENTDNVPKPHREAKQTPSVTIGANEGLVENQKKVNQSEMKSTIQSNDQAAKNKQGHQAHEEISGKQKQRPKDNPAVNTFNTKKEDPSQVTAPVKAESSKTMTTEKAESKYEAVQEESAPLLNLLFGQNETSLSDDSLQITGIMVMVRERTVNNGQWNNNTQEQMNAKEQECRNSALDKCHPSSDVEENEENKTSVEESGVKAKDSIVQITPTVKEDQTKVRMHNYHQQIQKNVNLETKQNNESENVTVNRTILQQSSCSTNAKPQGVTQLQEPLAENGVPSTVTVPAKNKESTETQLLLYKQDMIARDTNKMPNGNSTKSIKKGEVKRNTEDRSEQKSQPIHISENLVPKLVSTGINYMDNSKGVHVETLTKDESSMEEDMTTVINPSESGSIDGIAPQLEEKKYETTPKSFNNPSNTSGHLTENESIYVSPKHEYKETQTGENNQMENNVHIGSIAIKVVPGVTEKDNLKMVEKHHDTPVPPDEIIANECKQVAFSSYKEKVETLNNRDRTKELILASSDNQMEDKLGAEYVLSSVKPTPDSLKISNQQNNINTANGNRTPENNNKSMKSADESKTQPMEGDYFQVQGVAEANDKLDNGKSDAVSKSMKLSGLLPNKAANDSYSDGRLGVLHVLDQSKIKTMESSATSVQDENMKRETKNIVASKHSDGPPERQGNNEKAEEDQTIHIKKQHTEKQSILSARERQNSRSVQPTGENIIKEKPEVKPKPKQRASTIPEISAIADYARLKVIVSEDRANTIQEFPPNKKEGFFPLIQTRHSRRPVFTADPQDLPAKEKCLPNKKEVSSKVNKEPKPLVFPITEKEHLKTGMFKLGDKERQEKMLLDAKPNADVLQTGAKHAEHFKEKYKAPTANLKNQGREEQVARTDTQIVHQEDQSIHQSNDLSMKATTSSSAVNRPRNSSELHLKPTEKSNPHERPKELSLKAEGTPYLNNNFHPLVHPPTEDALVRIGEDRPDKLRQDRLATLHEETTAKQITAKQLEEDHTLRKEVEKKAEELKIKHMIEESRASLAEEERRVAQREEERRARERQAIAIKIKERRERQKEQERKAEEERRANQTEEMRANQREEERKMRQTEERRRIKMEEERKAKLKEEEQRIKKNEERRRVKEQEVRATHEQQRRAAQEQEEHSRAAQEQEEHSRAAQEQEQRRRAAQDQELCRRAAQEEQQRRAVQEEQQRRAVQKEQQRRAAQEEQQRRAAQEEEQQRRAAQEEQQRRAAQEEQQRRAAQEEQQRRAAQEEQQRRAAQEEQQRRAAQEEQQRRAAQEEQQRRAAIIQEQQRRAALIKEQQRRAALIKEKRRAKPIDESILFDIESDNERRQTEKDKAAQTPGEESIEKTPEQRKAQQQIEEQTLQRQKGEERMRTQREEEERRAIQQEKTIIKEREEKQAKKGGQAALIEEEIRIAQEVMIAQKENEIRAKKREEEEKLAAYREKERVTQMEEQNRATQKMDSLQYYAITSTEMERKHRERQICSPLPSQRRSNASGLESTEDSYARPYRPKAPASPAPSLPRSNTSSPALGVKPSMFRVKDNTIRGSSLTKSVKPRFHKNFGEDFRVGSPMGSERGEEEQETMRRSSVTPLHADTGLNRLAAIKESSTSQPASSAQDYSAPLPHHRPYWRRSIALDEDDARSVISNMSEDMESFATSAADLAELRGLYDYERPESACSFSSDVSRSLGKPPAVPPKSEKALRRAQRLTTRRIKKELSKGVPDSSAGVEKPLHEVSSIPSSPSTEVHSSNPHAVASPHFSPPVSLARAPTLESGLLSSHKEHDFSQSSFYASPHATGPISLPAALTHATAPVSLPVAPPHTTGPASQPAAPKTVADVPSSSTLHHANHPAPVTQYHVETNYPQSYPLTQRKVLQDLGSGQYFMVDVPVQVKTKTFFDPETGKYVQLNVRESAKSASRPQTQQAYLQPQLQPQIHVKPQKPLSQDSPAGKPFILYQGYHGYPKGYQPPAINSVPHSRSSTVTPHQDHQSASYGYPAPEMAQNSEGHRYSPEKTPYMDTVNDAEKTYNRVYNTHGPYESFPECDTNSQLAGSSVCENDNSAHSRYQPRDIITMSELEDFMELSDW